MKLILNALGMLLTIVGAIMSMKNAPKHFTVIDAREPDGGWEKHDRKMQLKNKLADYAVYMIIIGSLMQFASNFISTEDLSSE